MRDKQGWHKKTKQKKTPGRTEKKFFALFLIVRKKIEMYKKL